jgi:copper chaperone CopZ
MAKASIYFDLENLDGKRGAAKVKRQLNTLPGVISVSINDNHKRVAVDFDTTGANQSQIRKQLDGLGLTICGEHFEEHIM